jgi:hypothetical protein
MSLDAEPAADAPAQEWFLYFRVTKHLPAMKTKFNDAAQKTADPELNAKLRLAFAAAGLDICMPFSAGEPRAEKLSLLENYAGVSPELLLGLKATDIALLLRQSFPAVVQEMSALGYDMDEKCVLTRLNRPAP